jgi:hypothetical protein
MTHKPDDGETTSTSGSLAPGGDGGAQSGSAATPEDPERTIVVPRESHADEETTVVVNKKPVVDDPERTLVAPTPKAPQRSNDDVNPDAAPRGELAQSTSDDKGERTVYHKPVLRPGSGAPAGQPSSQRHDSSPASSLPPSGQPLPSPQSVAQSGFAPQPFPYGQANPYGYPPAAPYAAPPFGPVPPTGRRRSTQSAALLWGGVGLAAVVLAAGLVIGLSDPDLLLTKKLDVQAAQSEIQRVLTDDVTGYADKNVADVKCNNGENVTIKQGSSFTCQVSVDGASRRVTATFLDNNGNFEVGRPD